MCAMLLNEAAEENYLKAVVYGRSGTGKTSLGVTAPKPLIILSERQGYRSVKDSAMRHGIPVPPTIWIQNLDDMRKLLGVLQVNDLDPIPAAMRALMIPQNGTDEEKATATAEVEAAIANLPYQRPDTLVADSMTELFALIGLDIERTVGKKIGKDGLEQKSERHWGVLRDRSERLIKAYRDLPYHVLFLALLDDRMIGEGEEASRSVGPACPMRALPDALVAAVNLCGIMSVRQNAEKKESGEVEYKYERWVRFSSPSWMTTKPLPQLDHVEAPNFTGWLGKLNGTPVETDKPDLGDYDAQSDESLNQGDANGAEAKTEETKTETKTETKPKTSRRRRRGAAASK